MKSFDLFKDENWCFLKYDGRKKMFMGMTKEEFGKMKEVHFSRFQKKYWDTKRDFISKCGKRREDISYFATIPYEYMGDGLDDFNHYQRPCSDGVGYVSICPGEPRNNYYVEDPLTVRYLRSKYDRHVKATV